ncbi:GntR family transcriptional regulator [Streptomyces sp. NBC_01373]|uniref:GntR family transcriptional regulator n=1 Tax=Streptomyces sp. NBC_01373 TaxID=2903843 RepID=UPI00225611A3|nr:GntR family transcriptional regulator [Streptomyces sp. NBC_01373]MCX4697021.1 GntR family transcriptional regulator [Streptomyces sp. NBC_01373]MCX4707054.1 GntR family transcriptional regulator [Streptomyces sp. NBC_01373]
MPESPERTALYRLFDVDERLLYVGITTEPKVRMKAHAADKAWWSEVSTREFEWFDSRGEAAKAEVAAIRAERPVHNHAHNTAAALALLPVIAAEPLRPRPKVVTVDERGPAQRMAADLRALTMAGELSPGSRLPSTHDFCDRYKISNMTVQRGLRYLKDEGLAVGRNGQAVFVTSPTPPHLDDVEFYRTKDLPSAEKPPRRVLEAFGAGDGDLIDQRRFLVEVDDRPLRLVSTYRRANAPDVEGIEQIDQVSVRLPTSDELLSLQLPEDVPVLITFRRTLDVDGEVVEVQIWVEPGHLCQRQYRTPITPT